MSQKVEKIHILLDPPSPRKFWIFLNLGRIWNSMTPPPVPDLGKIWNWENFEFSEPHLKTWNLSLKHLKLPKNHFKTNLFFLQLKYLKCAFTFGKKMKIWPPPPLLSKSPHFELWTFWSPALTPSPLLDFFHFLGHFFLFLILPLVSFVSFFVLSKKKN